MPDRRAGGSIPHVGKQPRSRTKSGKWRKKRSDTGKKRPAQSWWQGTGYFARVKNPNTRLITSYTIKKRG